MKKISWDDVQQLETDELIFLPNDKHGISYNIFPTTGNDHCRPGDAYGRRSNSFPGQTMVDRLSDTIDSGLYLTQRWKPKAKKRALCGGGSVGAEAQGVAAGLNTKRVLGQYEIISSDISEEFTSHAKTFRLPKGMLINRPASMLKSFHEAYDDPRWIEPVEAIKRSIKISEPQDIQQLNDPKGFDIIFLFYVLGHLTPKKQNLILQNLLLQCHGMICFSIHRINGKYPEGVGNTWRRLEGLFSECGYRFVDPKSRKLLFEGGELDFSSFSYNTYWTLDKGNVPIPDLQDGCIAIHPDLAAQMT